MFAALITALGKDAGYTRIGAREIVVIDFQERAGFAGGVALFASAMAATNPVIHAGPFTAQSEYRPHDWRAEPEGASLLAEIGKAFLAPGIETKLRGLRDRYERLASGGLTHLSARPAAG